ncbi:MAG TPA: alpha-ketoglutarate-dependent dioxygenase AlkB [Actinomycetota bacterium]|nr:alpha-ketoglutarate-dependent dioxygenase AlkB [Actinomycetota bacterium]
MARQQAVRAEPSGLVYHEDFLSSAEQEELLEVISRLEFDQVVMHGQPAKRQVAHFGYLYGYESFELQPGPQIPPELGWLRSRCGELAGMDPERLDEALVTRYPPGAGIGWHRDAPSFGSKVVGVSLLGESRMRFQRTVAGVRYVSDRVLAPGSAYVLQDEARWAWQHSIPAVKQLRYSVTFRTVREPERWST